MLKYAYGLRLFAFYIYCTVIGLSAVNANDLTVSVTDQAGDILQGAVVYLERADGKPIGLKHNNTTRVIDQRGEMFSPYITALSVGDTLEFHNTDPITHHVYSFSKAKPINIIVPARQSSDKFTFEKQGVVALGCNIHDHMAAFIYIAPSPVSGVSDKEGKIQFQGLPDGDYKLSSWHHRVPQSQTSSQKVSITNSKDITVEVAIRRDRKGSSRRRKDERPY